MRFVKNLVASRSLGNSPDRVGSVGARTTDTFPLGMVGNDRPISRICDTWLARELGVIVLRAFSDPRFGVTTLGAKNLNTGEPDPSLFQVPAGYRIVDETGPATLRFARP